MSNERELFKKDPEGYLKRKHETPDPLPTLDDLKKTRLYFTELEDALTHYSSPFEKGKFFTVTARKGEDGEPVGEIVTETRFPALDDLPDHLKILHYTAGQLDLLGEPFWRRVWDADPSVRNELPYFPMQIVLWGLNKGDNSKFSFKANMYDMILRDFGWSTSQDPDSYRDDAEQCFRIMDAYIQIKENREDFGNHGLSIPESF